MPRRPSESAAADRGGRGFRIANDPRLVAPAVAALTGGLERAGLGDGTARAQVGFALGEALYNALYHGNLELDLELLASDPQAFHALALWRRRQRPYCQRRVEVRAAFAPAEAQFEIRDQGRGFDTTLFRTPFDPDGPLRPGGGLIRICSHVDQVGLADSGHRLTLTKRFPTPG